MADSNNKKSYSPSRGPNQGGGFKEFMYNSNTGAVMGRTGASWIKIIIFYIIFFSGLAAFFVLNFYIFYLTLNMDSPKYTMGDSLIGSNPGVGFRPMPDPDQSADSTLIWFSRSDDEGYKFWTNQLDKYVKEIETGKATEGSQNLQSCTFDNGKKAEDTKACQVDVAKFEECNSGNFFGYNKGEPCILIKLNKIYGWEPEPYGIDDSNRYSRELLVKDLDNEIAEKGMPAALKETILSRISIYENATDEVRKTVLQTVWISCAGENVADEENIGKVAYYPLPGIAGYFFPYKKQQGYQSPFIFVQFKNPVSGVLINVECKAFAKNVIPDRLARLASTHFELLID